MFVCVASVVLVCFLSVTFVLLSIYLCFLVDYIGTLEVLGNLILWHEYNKLSLF